MNTKARKLRKDFLQCADQRSIEENLNRVQDMYGYEEEVEVENIIEEGVLQLDGVGYGNFGSDSVIVVLEEETTYYLAVDDAVFDGQVTYSLGGVLKKIELNNGMVINNPLGGSDLGSLNYELGESYANKEVSIKIYTKEKQTTTHPINHKFLPEGYPWEEKVEHVIEWDGNTEGLEPILAEPGGTPYFHISDKVVPKELLVGTNIKVSYLNDGAVAEKEITQDQYDAFVESYPIENGAFVMDGLILYVYEAGITLNDYTFPEVGVYVLGIVDYFHTSWVETTLVPLAEKFLPPGAGIKTAIIKSSNYDSFLSGITLAEAETVTYECINMTFDEAMQTMMAGEPLQAVIMFVSSFAENLSVAVNTVGYVLIGADPNSGEYTLNILYTEALSTSEIRHGFTWTSDGINTGQ